MKRLRLLGLVGITSIALVHAGLAAGHGGGGGSFGGGGFSGGGGGHFGGGARGGVGGAPHFGGGAFGAPHMTFGGVASRGGGVGVYRPSNGVSQFATGPTHVRSFVPSRSTVRQSSSARSTRGLTNAGRSDRTANSQARATTAVDRPNRAGSVNNRTTQTSRVTTARPSNEAAFSRQHHIFARENGAQHSDWDRRHAHFFNGHWWCWDGAFWIGLDDGFYPWDFYPYYAYDYYPYDYYTDDEAVYQNYTAQGGDSNVSAVQADLAQLGYYNGPIDGIFGPDMRTALTHYQINYHLQVTGSLTNDTLQSLGLPGLASAY